MTDVEYDTQIAKTHKTHRDLDCPLCKRTLHHAYTLTCQHNVCVHCLENLCQTIMDPHCPHCQIPLTYFDIETILTLNGTHNRLLDSLIMSPDPTIISTNLQYCHSNADNNSNRCNSNVDDDFEDDVLECDSSANETNNSEKNLESCFYISDTLVNEFQCFVMAIVASFGIYWVFYQLLDGDKDF